MSAEPYPDPADALAELRARLEQARAAKRLTKARLAERIGLGRTTVSEAFRAGGPIPSTETVAALAHGLGLDRDVRSLLDLRAAARTDAAAPVPASGPGRPIAEWDPLDLEVHPAADPPPRRAERRASGEQRRSRTKSPLPPYVVRPHDRELADLAAAAASGRSQMAVLVGPSSTGKTRACWEAVQPLAGRGWSLWHPFDPGRAEAALADLRNVGPRTVVWMNEAQHYLGAASGLGERIAAALHSLLTDPRSGPVLVLCTLWPQYAAAYTALPIPEEADVHPRVRELLAGRVVTLPHCFDEPAMRAARALAATGDWQIADALRHAPDGRLTQHLAGAPQLLDRYRTGSPPARAILEAAMDARRLGVGLSLPIGFLEAAAEDYLSDDEYDALDNNWLERALAELGETVHGNLAPLRRVRPRAGRDGPPAAGNAVPVYRLADSLEQHGREDRRARCPRRSFWQAAHDHLVRPEDLATLSYAAEVRQRTYWAECLLHKAAEAGDAASLTRLAMERSAAAEPAEAERLFRSAAEAGDPRALTWFTRRCDKRGEHARAERLANAAAAAGSTSALSWLAQRRGEEGDLAEAERIALVAAAAGDASALRWLTQRQAWAGEPADAERLARTAADTGSAAELHWLAQRSGEQGEYEEAERIALLAAAVGDAAALRWLTQRRDRDGEHAEAERLARLTADAGDTTALYWLADRRAEAGEHAQAERLLRLAADAGDTAALARLARGRERLGEHDEARRLFRLAAEAGNASAWTRLVQLCDAAGDPEEAEQLALQALRTGTTAALNWLAERRRTEGEPGDAERLARMAADAGDASALALLAVHHGEQGAYAEAERLALLVAGTGNTSALVRLVAQREAAGEPAAAERLALLAAEAGNTAALTELAGRRDRVGRFAEAERLARLAADAGDTLALTGLALRCGDAGDRDAAERLAKAAVDAGMIGRSPLAAFLGRGPRRQTADGGAGSLFVSSTEFFEWLWPAGLDPDGTPSAAR
ncbi:helix-turn-helix domain-containing protein [Streptomyces sp. NPDC051976]|uniref:helix-turn-helix domain-containing protein n=1 Tax=Streptomyces sp. NPDC051976 TaxID=3154947 RepID=UPI003446A56E